MKSLNSRRSWRALVVSVATLASAQDAPGADRALSARNADYTIDVRLDAESKTLEGAQVLTWTNLQDRPAAELWFHLYWNAWRNSRSTWMSEDRGAGRSDRGDDIREQDWGYLEVLSTRMLREDGEAVELSDRQRFAAPDDGNADDRTVLVVSLPEPVEPGGTIRVEMTWRAKIPRTFARTGFRGDFFFLAHWFPKLGVFEADGWNCHQFHATTEFYSDYGVYDVRIVVPERFVVGATGRETATTDNGDGTVTHRFEQADVHGFAWTASPDYRVAETRFEEAGLPPIEVRFLYQPEHADQVERHLAAARAAFEHYGTWFGAYPYGHVTVVDPAYDSGAGGMEYPTLFTCGTRLFNPPEGGQPESVTVHEAGHQFWYGIVGNDEFEHAWLDEGLNTYSQLRVLNLRFPDRVLVRRFLSPPGGEHGDGFFPVAFPEIDAPWFALRLGRYRGLETADITSRASFRYYPRARSALSYSKPALWLTTLERHLGWETLQPILAEFFRRHAFGHPTPEDFFAVFDDMAGQDLTWFFDQVYRDSVRFDYAVDAVDSAPASPTGFVGPEGDLTHVDGDDDETGTFRTEVVVRRLGEGYFPVDVLLVFEDGHTMRQSWDGRSRWKRFVAERPAELDYAVVDPDRVLMLDVDATNNSLLRESSPTLPAVKWSTKWMIWLQDLLASFEFFL